MKLLSIGVTLDGLVEYGARLGLPEDGLGLSPDEPDPVYGRAWPRALAFLARRDLTATFFVVGRYLERPIPVALAREAAASGHELASRGFDAPARFGALGEAEVREELRRGAEALVSAAGARPRGFSAPGHQASAAALRALAAGGYAYDASALPYPAYALSRAAAALGIAPPAGLLPAFAPAVFGPRRPYRPSPGLPALKGSAALLELPVSALPGLRLPLTGGVLAALGPKAATLAARVARREDFVHVLLGGADFLEEGEVSPELARRRYLTAPLEERLGAIEAALEVLAAGAEVITLADAADRLTKGGL
jgi:peptidoglycan-N-acetylglucosamine deacetylase